MVAVKEKKTIMRKRRAFRKKIIKLNVEIKPSPIAQNSIRTEAEDEIKAKIKKIISEILWDQSKACPCFIEIVQSLLEAVSDPRPESCFFCAPGGTLGVYEPSSEGLTFLECTLTNRKPTDRQTDRKAGRHRHMGLTSL